MLAQKITDVTQTCCLPSFGVFKNYFKISLFADVLWLIQCIMIDHLNTSPLYNIFHTTPVIWRHASVWPNTFWMCVEILSHFKPFTFYLACFHANVWCWTAHFYNCFSRTCIGVSHSLGVRGDRFILPKGYKNEACNRLFLQFRTQNQICTSQPFMPCCSVYTV